MSKVENGKAPAVLSYFLVGILWWLIDEKVKKNAFVKFHVKQALVLFILAFIVGFIAGLVWFVPLISMIVSLLQFGIIVLWIIGVVRAVQGAKKELPLIGSFAKNFKF